MSIRVSHTTNKCELVVLLEQSLGLVNCIVIRNLASVVQKHLAERSRV